MTENAFDYEQLRAMGWAIDPHTGINRQGFASVSFCLYIEDRKHVCLPGFGFTVTEAIADVVNGANDWIRKQRASHPMYRLMETGSSPEKQTA